jgi:carbamoyltransferase
MYTIGIHDGHCASLALMKNDEVIFAIQEERITRIKNSGGFPVLSLKETLKRFNLKISDIDEFIFAGKLSSGIGMENREAVLKKNYNNFYLKNFWKYKLKKKIIPKLPLRIYAKFVEKRVKNQRIKQLINLGINENKIKYVDHHNCHAAAAAYGWAEKGDFLVITSDSAGDFICGSINIFSNGKLNKIAEVDIGSSVARLYGYFTYYLGMVPNEHEYKVMGMAPYSHTAKESHEIAEYFLSLFEFKDDFILTRKKNIEATKFMGKRIESFLKRKRFDHVCSGIQIFIEKIISEWIKKIINKTKINKVALSGGLFMNVKLNQIISNLPEVQDLFVFPSCGDETNVFGALYQNYKNTTNITPKKISHFYYGNKYSNEEALLAIKNYEFNNCKIKYTKIENIEKKIAELINEKKIVARFKGAMEFGARSLGNRAILADPTTINSVYEINKIIKARDFWMPFAPSIIDQDEYLENPKNLNLAYMINAVKFKKKYESVFRGVVHPYDLSCRPQVVLKEHNESYYNLIKIFKSISGYGVILNTSLNLHGLPMVSNPNDSLYVLDNSGLKYLAIEDYLIEKII